MVKAYPIDGKGQRIGPMQTFTDLHWNTMKAQFGKKLRFVEAEEDNHDKETIISTKNARRRDKKNEK